MYTLVHYPGLDSGRVDQLRRKYVSRPRDHWAQTHHEIHWRKYVADPDRCCIIDSRTRLPDLRKMEKCPIDLGILNSLHSFSIHDDSISVRVPGSKCGFCSDGFNHSMDESI